MNTPNIRFKGFTEDWEKRKIQWFVDESIIDTPMDGNHGEKHPTTEDYVDNGIPFLMASDIHNGIVDINNCKFISEERANKLDKGFAKNNDVLITHKATIGEVAILKGLLTDYAMLTPQVTYYRIKDNNRLSQKYLYAWFNADCFQKEIKSKAAQSTRAYIGISAQRDLTIQKPNSINEQKAIGNLIYNLDHLITLHQRKCDDLKEVKKYMLQKMFPKKGEKVPEIRFKGFTGDWKVRKLGDVANKVTAKNTGKQYVETFTNSAEQGIISQLDYFDHDVSNMDNIDGYYIVEDNDFVYNPRISTSAPVGPINRNKMGRTGVMSPLYTVFRTHDVDEEYLEWYFKSSCWHKFMFFNGDTGARADRFAIKNSVFFEMPIPAPHIDEQRKIGRYMTTLDNQITLYQKKLDTLKEVKKFMLQNMFPQ